MKTEVLKSIKQTEDEYRTLISAAEEERKRSISDAKIEAVHLIEKARKDAEEYRKQRLGDARKEAQFQYAALVAEGREKAAAMKERSRTQYDKAVEFLLTRFKEQLNV